MSEINNAFRTKLYNWRVANNYSPAEAATSLKVPYSSCCHWEAGDNKPRAATLAKILPVIDEIPAPVQEPVEELWVPEPVEPKRPLTFRERMEKRYGSMEEYYAKTRGSVVPVEEEPEEEPEVEVVAELPLEAPAKPTPSLVKLTKVIGFLECLALYAAEGVAEPLEQQIKTLQTIAEEMSA